MQLNEAKPPKKPKNVKERFHGLSKKQKWIIIGNALIIYISIMVVLVCYCSKPDFSGTLVIDPVKLGLSTYYRCKHRILTFQTTTYGNYWLLQNVVIGEQTRVAGCADYVTYVTHGHEFDFFQDLADFMEDWQAPVSVSIFAPGDDLNMTLSFIQYARECTTHTNRVQRFVSFHIFFPSSDMPEWVPHSEQQALNWPIICDDVKKMRHWQSYARRNRLPYPEAVATNIARRSVNTHFILTGDRPFKSSQRTDISSKFLAMLMSNNCISPEKQSLTNCRSTTSLLETPKMYFLPTYKEEIRRKAAPNITKYLLDSAAVVSISNNHIPFMDERILVKRYGIDINLQYYAICLGSYKFEMLAQDFEIVPTQLRRQFSENLTSSVNENIENMKDEYVMLYGSRILSSSEKCKPYITKN